MPPINLFLIGFMGSGKSYWGKLWAKKYHYSFFDLDNEIEKAFMMSVEEIFEKHGEEKFRELERYHLQKFENRKELLISCGGGTPCFFDNMDWMLKNGTTVYLKGAPQYLLDRVMDETEKRPLVKNVNPSELLFFIQQKLKEREPVYNRASVILDVETLNENSLELIFPKIKNEDLSPLKT